MSTHRFRERTTFSGSKVDAASGKVTDVLLCGHTSANGRDYPPDALRNAVKAYEGAKVFLNHSDASTVERLGGWIENVRYESGSGVRGDFHALLKHPGAAHFLEIADRNPSMVGFSHVAVCKTRRKNGRDVIESISKVESVDLVVGPATTKGFFESTQHPGNPMKLTEYVAAGLVKFPDSAGFKALKEMVDLPMDMGDDAPPMDAAPTDSDPVKAAFVTAMKGLVDQYDSGEITDAELLTKFKDVLKSHVKLSGKAAAPADDAPPPDDAAKESVQKIARLTVENMALRAGVTLTEVQTKAVLGLTDDADRKTLVESFKPAKSAGGEKPVSGESQHGGNRTVKESASQPMGGAKYAEWLNQRD